MANTRRESPIILTSIIINNEIGTYTVFRKGQGYNYRIFPGWSLENGFDERETLVRKSQTDLGIQIDGKKDLEEVGCYESKREQESKGGVIVTPVKCYYFFAKSIRGEPTVQVAYKFTNPCWMNHQKILGQIQGSKTSKSVELLAKSEEGKKVLTERRTIFAD